MLLNHVFSSALAFVGAPGPVSFTRTRSSSQRTRTSFGPSAVSFMSAVEVPSTSSINSTDFLRCTDSDGNLSPRDLSLHDLSALFVFDDDADAAADADTSSNSKGLLSLRSGSNGERGVFPKKDIGKDDIILQIPLSSCIRDDNPPQWYSSDETHEDDHDNPHNYKPSDWAVRLAASLIDMQLDFEIDGSDITHDATTDMDMDMDMDTEYNTLLTAKKAWLAMMPDPDYLRASLPVHWPEDILAKAKCTALELANDASYFTRAEALSDLEAALQSCEEIQNMGSSDLDFDLQSFCSNAWDLVQTRSCRVERIDGIQLCPPLRVLAPGFDFINHGSCQHEGGGSSNAYFGLEGDEDADEDDANTGRGLYLAVRARRGIKANEEILIDYGDSARPAWRCLASYGFVPNYRVDNDATDDDADDDDSDNDNDNGQLTFGLAEESVAELFYNGVRYEVTRDTIPTELVEAAYATYLEDEIGASAFDTDADADADVDEPTNMLPPNVALRIAKRMSDAAFDLLIDHPDPEDSSDSDNNSGQETEVGFDAEAVAIELASELRWSQHQVLLACAIGLRDYAAREAS